MYATRTTAATFKLLTSKSQRQQVGADGVESVLMLQSIGIGATVAVVPLFSWHCYLMGSAQTTIEYFGNGESAARHPQRSYHAHRSALDHRGGFLLCACKHTNTIALSEMVLSGGEDPRSGRQRAAVRGGAPMPRSAYSQGLWLNWVAVFGDGNPILALLPSLSDSVRPSPPYPDGTHPPTSRQ
jgi:hypothetical protein